MRQVPIFDWTFEEGGAFGIVSKPFKAGTATGVGVTGLTFAAIVTNATWIALAVTGLAVVVVGINAIDGIYGKQIRKALK